MFDPILFLRSIPKGARVTVSMENSYKLAEVILFCFKNDLVVVPIDPYVTKEKKDFIIQHSESYALIEDNQCTLGLNVLTPYDGTSLIIYTSGSTGDPKGVVLSKDAVIENAKAVGLLHGFDKGLRHATCLPLYHCNALCMSLIGTSVYRQPFFLLEKFSAQDYINFINENKIQTAAIVPALLEKLVQEKLEIPDCLNYFITAAAPLSSSLAERFYNLYGPRLLQGYGLSEAVNFSFVMPKLDKINFIRQYIDQYPPVGLPLDGIEVRLDNGEVLVKGKSLMNCYLKNEKTTRESFTPDGYLRTGDLGYFRDGYLVLSGRKKEVVNRGGEIIYPREIEEDWARHDFGDRYIAFAVENNLLSDEIGMWTETYKYKDLLTLVTSAYYRPLVVQTGKIITTSVGKPQRKKMGATLVTRSIQQDMYLAVSNRCREIAKKIVDTAQLIPDKSRGAYILKEAILFLATSDEVHEVVSTDSQVIFRALNVFESNIENILSSNVTGAELMRQNKGLWRGLMDEFPMGEYAKLCADFLLKRRLLEGKVLELGAGVGNTSNLINGYVNEQYIRSDVGMDLNKSFQIGHYEEVDFNRSFPVENLDVIFATNALHCALDKKKTLGYVHEALKDGGIFVIAEGEPITYNDVPWALNMFYGMFDGWWNIGGFMSRSEWISLFQEAGFQDIGWSVLRAGRYDLGGIIWGKK